MAEVGTLLKRAYKSREPGAHVHAGLVKIAEALNRGDLTQAMIRAVHLRLPEPDWDAAVRLAQANDNLAKYSPDQPRDGHGRWTNEDGTGAMGGAVEAKPNAPDSQRTTVKPVAQFGEKTADTPKAPPAYRVSTAADFALPETIFDAPHMFVFSPTINQESQSLWRESLAPLLNANPRWPLPEGRKEWVVEQGATIVARRDGTLEFQNIGGLPRTESEKSAEFHPDLQLKDPDSGTVIGTQHTHPYDDGTTGVSFSGSDIKYLMDERINFSLVQSGEDQYLFLKTKQTGHSKDYERGGSGFVEGYQDNRVSQMSYSKDPSRMNIPMPDAAEIANMEAALMYNLVLYKGRNGILYRIWP
ncbi:hypothetical protein [Nitrospirillum pindoramense]|uniref:DUF4329 domain-containing protein n=1 Tax=Nitrospirillum amazonense TaxID=28077 RepID=A0A560GUT9_9PROT|nr:hypothetical protein [Nitrospirillum amazonense]TWB37200.1 hypothetical protein FBZ90_11513 [Nitrospirillum amazonense]